MTAQLVTLGAKIKLVTPIASVLEMPHAQYSKFKNDQEYLIVGYSHWDTGRGAIVPRLNLAAPDVIDGPLTKGNPKLYFQNHGTEYIVVDDLRRVQVEILGSTAVSVPLDFVKIAVERRFLPPVENVRPGFSPLGVDLVKREEGDVYPLLWCDKLIEQEQGMVEVNQPYKADLRPRLRNAVKKAPSENFNLDVVNGPQ